jgi:hypothetical protein
MGEEKKIVNVGWVSLSKSEKSLTIKVLNQLFFVPLRDLDSVLQGRRNRADVKQWVEQRQEGWETEEEEEEEWEEEKWW